MDIENEREKIIPQNVADGVQYETCAANVEFLKWWNFFFYFLCAYVHRSHSKVYFVYEM